MRTLSCSGVLLLVSLALSSPARAVAPIITTDLPDSIQSCITAATCAVNTTSAYHSDTATAFLIQQNTGSGVEANYLMRYQLAPPSAQSRLDPPLDDAFGGHVWMLAKGTYSAGEAAHPFTLFFDAVTPTPFPMFGQSGDLSLFMTTTDLLAGSAFKNWGLDSNNIDYSYGDLSGEVPLPCVAEDCDVYAQLNLLQLTYENQGANIALTGFNAQDARALLYTQQETFPCYGDVSCVIDDSQSYYVSSVPLPGALWLFGSGVIGLIAAGRSKKR